MGSDIHGGFIKVSKNDEGDIIQKLPVKTSWTMERDYTLFAILAGVRNGYGFAGCYRHEPLTPVAEGRGKPDFLVYDEDDYCPELYNKWYGRWGGESELGEYLGDHSFTYMTLDEILDWNGWDKHLMCGGVVEVKHYEETLALGENPEQWYGGVGGGSIKVLSQEDYLLEKGNTSATHVQCYWKNKYSLAEDYEWFLNEIIRIKNEFGGETYLVIGFDS